MADLWTRPTSTPYQFATDPGVRLEPIAGRKAEGWLPGQPVSALQANDLWGVASDWIVLLEAIAPADGTLAAQAVELYDTAGTPALAATWTAGSVADSALLTCGAGGFEFREKGLVNPRAFPDGTTGIRFGYDSGATLQIVHHLGPNGGGWMSIMDVGGAVPSDWIHSGGFCFLYTDAAGDARQRWNLSIPYESTQSSGFPKIITLAATFVNAAADLAVQLIRITRSTGAETTIGSAITSASPSHTYAAGGYQTDPTLYDYCFEAAVTGLGGGLPSTDGLQNIRATIKHLALNPSV